MKRGNKFGAKKTACRHGHTHDSGREAKRCDDLHLMQRGGEIESLEVQPKFVFAIGGRQLKHDNGHLVGYKADFRFVDRQTGRTIIEDAKPSNPKARGRDWPLRKALFRALYPDLLLREV